jgi:eukaryotic-like serine/threonine-protein kinase
MTISDARHYKAFISYSHADRNWAMWLHRSLEAYRTPKNLLANRSDGTSVPRRLTPIFHDREELPSSPDLPGRINTALLNSENLIVLCSPAAAASHWVNREIEYFKQQGRSKRIFCLIVDGDPAAENLLSDCFPPALRTFYDDQGQPGNEKVEPVAADVRRHGDGKDLALLKLLAGLLNVGLDDLRQREHRRRLTRLTWIASGSLTAAVFTIVLAVNAVLARNEANQRRAQAEDLLGFMVGDLRNSLAKLGRLDLLQEVGNRAMVYFATVDVNLLSDDELLRQAQVLTQLGEIRVEQLNFAEALASFSEAYERSEALSAKDRSDGERLFNRAQAEYWVGYVHWRNGSLPDAESWFTRYRDTALELMGVDPGRDDWLREVSYGYHNLAVLAEERGDIVAAEEGFRYTLQIFEQLLERNEDNGLRRDIADLVSWLGNISLSRNDLQEAKRYFQLSARQFRSILDDERVNAINQEELAFAIYRVARLSAIMGELDEALLLMNESIRLFVELVVRDTSNASVLRKSMAPKVLKANVLVRQANLDDAQALAEESNQVLNGLLSNGNSEPSLLAILADTYMVQASIQAQRNNLESALELNSMAIELLTRVEQNNRLNDDRGFTLASAYTSQGELLLLANDTERAREIWRVAEDLVVKEIEKDVSYFVRDPWVRILHFTGRSSNAREYSETLAAGGYIPLRPWPF